jgi:uncharacterized protein YciI
MDFDHFSVVMLRTRNVNSTAHDDDDAIQDAHMAYLASLHREGKVLAAGPAPHEDLRGIVIFLCDVNETVRLMDVDPSVKAGWFDVEVIPWSVPRDVLTFSSAPLPRSMSELD